MKETFKNIKETLRDEGNRDGEGNPVSERNPGSRRKPFKIKGI
jgi:hypothetical protein